MKLKFASIAVLGLAIYLPSVAVAVPFSLYNTGVDDDGNALAGGAADTHYTVSVMTAPPQVDSDNPSHVLTNPHWSYVANSSTSQWIWENANGSPTNVTRVFRTTFDLTGYDHTTAVLTGLWATDNRGLAIFANGVNTNNFLPGGNPDPIINFTTLHAFTVSTDLVAGINTLDFVIQDTGIVAGFRTDNLMIQAEQLVPEPGALLLMSLGLILVGFQSHKRS